MLKRSWWTHFFVLCKVGGQIKWAFVIDEKKISLLFGKSVRKVLRLEQLPGTEQKSEKESYLDTKLEIFDEEEEDHEPNTLKRDYKTMILIKTEIENWLTHLPIFGSVSSRLWKVKLRWDQILTCRTKFSNETHTTTKWVHWYDVQRFLTPRIYELSGWKAIVWPFSESVRSNRREEVFLLWMVRHLQNIEIDELPPISILWSKFKKKCNVRHLNCQNTWSISEEEWLIVLF